MTTEVSLFPTFLSNLITSLRATSGYRDPATASTDIPVYDGPRPNDAGDMQYLVVGDFDDPEVNEPTPADIAYVNSPAFNPRAREESWRAPCVAVAWSGDTDISTLRTAAFGIYSTVETLLRTDMTQGISSGTVRSQIIGATWRQFQTDAGAEQR